MKTAPFPINPELTAIAIAYRNPSVALIADLVMPRIKPVGVREFKWMEFSLADSFTIPSTLVGRKGRPNQVSWSAEEKTSSVLDYALDDPIPYDDITQGKKAGLNVLGDSVEFLMHLLRLDREVRVAGMVFDPDNYADVTTLSGTDIFTDPAAGPVETIRAALNSMLIRGNSLTFGQPAWNAFATHSQTIASVYPSAAAGNGGKPVVTREQAAQLLEVDNIYVGNSYVNNARKGQDPSLTRAWGGHVACHYQDKMATNKRGATWGITVPYSTPIAGSSPDEDIGMRGGEKVRAGESLREVVVAKPCGHLIQNVA